MSKIQVQEIGVDDETTLEILQYGIGKPSALLLAGVHGDEKTGPALLSELSHQLTSIERRGRISLLPIASPKTYAANQRIHPDDGHDLNRCFLGGVAPTNSPSGRLVAAIQQLIRQHEVVIDLHGFPHQLTPIVGVFLQEGETTLRQRSDELLRAFNPEVIWELGTQGEESKKLGSACSYALKQKIPALGFELADPEYYSEAQWDRVIRGLIRILGKAGCINPVLPEVTRQIPRYEDRKVSRALFAGTFIPRKRLFDLVSKVDVVGELVRANGECKAFYAEHDGMVLTIAPEGQLQVEQKMFATAVSVSI